MATTKPTEPVGYQADAAEDGAPIEGTATDVAIREDVPQSVFRVLDRHDEELVAAEIKGELIATMAYEFTVGGQKARGLSYAGVNSAVRIMNARGVGRIKCPPSPRPQYAEVTDEEGDAAWECEVYAVDELVGGGAWGRAAQKKCMKLRNGTEKPDTFSKSKALSKAQRNAKGALIPETLKAEMIATLTSGQIERIPNQTEEVHRATLPPADESPEAAKLDEDNRQAMEVLGFRSAKAKARFDAYRTLAQKRELRDMLQAQVDQQADGS